MIFLVGPVGGELPGGELPAVIVRLRNGWQSHLAGHEGELPGGELPGGELPGVIVRL